MAENEGWDVSDSHNRVGDYVSKQLALGMLGVLAPDSDAVRQARALYAVTNAAADAHSRADDTPEPALSGVLLEVTAWLGVKAVHVLVFKVSLPLLLFQELLNLGVESTVAPTDARPTDRDKTKTQRDRLEAEDRSALAAFDERLNELRMWARSDADEGKRRYQELNARLVQMSATASDPNVISEFMAESASMPVQGLKRGLGEHPHLDDDGGHRLRGWRSNGSDDDTRRDFGGGHSL